MKGRALFAVFTCIPHVKKRPYRPEFLFTLYDIVCTYNKSEIYYVNLSFVYLMNCTPAGFFLCGYVFYVGKSLYFHFIFV